MIKQAAVVVFLTALASCGKGADTSSSIATEPGELTAGKHVFRGELPKGWERRGTATLQPPSGATSLGVGTATLRSGGIVEMVAKDRARTVARVVAERDALESMGNEDHAPKGMGEAHDIDEAGHRGYVVMTRTPGKSGSTSSEPGCDGAIYWQAEGVVARCSLELRGEQAAAYRAFIEICLGLEASKKP
jgi:hypothetical protein